MDVLRGWPPWLDLLVVMFDVDDLGRVNKEFGHHAGDRVLEGVGELVSDAIPDAPAFRYGGDQFVVLVEGSQTDRAARSAAEQVRRRVASFVDVSNGHRAWITASVGAARARNGQAERAFEEAYRAVHEAKAQGKNCVVMAG
jgi:diguanylate cyclase (GGDEF)-like protein